MNTRQFVSIVVPILSLSLLALDGALRAQDPEFTLSFDAPGMASGALGSTARFQARVLLATDANPTAGSDDPRGAAGWTLSIDAGGAGARVAGATTRGTAVEALSRNGFERVEIVDPDGVPNFGGRIPWSEIPADAPQGPGVVSGVALSLTDPVELPPRGAAVILLLDLECVLPAEARAFEELALSFLDGKQSGGEPVRNLITFQGRPVAPVRKTATVRCGAQPAFGYELRVLPGRNLGPVEPGNRLPVFAPPCRQGPPVLRVGVYISSDSGTEHGAAGYSIAISNDPCLELMSVTTIPSWICSDFPFSPRNCPQSIDPDVIANPGGTVRGSEVPPDRPQGPGVVFGVVLSLLEKKTLPPSGSAEILQIVYGLPRIPEPGEEIRCGIRFRDGLKPNAGQPTKNVLTYRGGSIPPLARRDLEPLVLFAPASRDVRFIRGDANDDARVDIADAVWILGELFLGTAPAACPEAADANDDGGIDISDPVHLLEHQFLGGSPPPPPFPGCGRDLDRDGLECLPGCTRSCSPAAGV